MEDGSEAYRVVFSPNSDYLASYGRSCDITILDMRLVVQENRNTVKVSGLNGFVSSRPAC